MSIPDLQKAFLGLDQADLHAYIDSAKSIDNRVFVKKEAFIKFLESRGTDAQVALVDTNLPVSRG